MVSTDMSSGGTPEFREDVLAQQRYHLVFEQSPAGIVLLDPLTGQILEANETASRQLGYSVEELTNLKLSDIEASESAAETLAHIDKVMTEGSDQFETLHRTKDGRIRNVSVWVKKQLLAGRTVFYSIFSDITEQRQAEAQVRLQSAALNATGAAVVITNASGSIQWTNPAYSELTGYTFEECTGKNPRDLIKSGKQSAEVYKNLWHTILAGKIWRGRLVNRRKDGSLYTEEQSITPVLGSAGRIEHFVAVKQDVSERAVLEKRLSKTEMLFRKLTESTRDVLWISDSEADRILYVSPAFEAIWGFSCEGIYATPGGWKQTIHPEDRGRIADAQEQKADGTFDEEYRIVRPDGTVRWIRDRASPILRDDGSSEGLVGVVQDVSDRMAAKLELRQREDHFASLIESVSDLILVTNDAGMIRFASPSSERILGYRPEELAGSLFLDLVHPEDRLAAAACLRQASGEPILSEYRCRRKDDVYRILQSAGKNDSRIETGFIVINARDVTDSRQLEEKLLQSQKMEAIGKLSGGVAHDFNNLLTVILGHLEIVRSADLPEDTVESLEAIKGAAERATNLTRQLLLFARRQALELQPLDLRQVVESTGRMLQRILGEDIVLEISANCAQIPVIADSGLLDQVLVNLAVNARDAMPRGGTLGIRTDIVEKTTVERDGRFALLSVTDRGTGIPASVLPRIFEPFFTTKDIGKGTGLGLSTVLGIVQQHGGWIEVESAEKQGTSFAVFLPLASEMGLEASTPIENTNLHGSETILFVEDDDSVRQIAIRYLTDLGYQVISANCGAEALELWAHRKADIKLVITDIVMPGGMSGIELGGILAAHCPLLPVVYASGYSDLLASNGLSLDPDVNFLIKPYPLPHMCAVLRRQLDRRRL